MDWLRYQNQNATRNDPLDPRLVRALASYLPQMGLTMDVFSGGQEAAGQGGNRVGSIRHDHGGAGDVFFNKGDRRLDWANPEDLPIFQEIVRRGREAGITGWGAGEGYMQPGSMHLGFGSPAVWGRGGKGANAPQWLRDAYGDRPLPKQYALDTSDAVDTSGYEKDSAPPSIPTDPRLMAMASASPVADGQQPPAPDLPPPYDVADRPIFELGGGGTEVAAAPGMAKPKTLAGKLGGALGKFGSAVTGGGGIQRSSGASLQPVQAARLDAPAAQSTVDPGMADQQRQMLAMALARLNSGRLA